MTAQTIPIVQVDAFADAPFSGNPAAVMPLEAWFDDDLLQAIAAENNLSETAFYLPDASGKADFELRWFTPTTEHAMCGQATLASGHVVLSQSDADSVSFRTRKAGVLNVTRDMTRDGDGYALDLPVTLVERRDNAALLAALGCDGEVYESISGAEETAIVLLDSEAAVRALAPDMRALGQIELMAIVTAPGEEADIASRVFVPAWGVDEDPVTGSAHAALTPFWAERLGTDEFTAVQASTRGGRMTCCLDGDRAILGGRCVTVIEGVMRV